MPSKKKSKNSEEVKKPEGRKKTSAQIEELDASQDIDYTIEGEPLDNASEEDDIPDLYESEYVDDAANSDISALEQKNQKIMQKKIQNLKERYEFTPEIVKNIVVLDPKNYITSEVLTKFEITEIISIRSLQIQESQLCFTDVGDLTDPILMAKKELNDKKCPLSIVRNINTNLVEIWDVNKMAKPVDYM
jgi:DNA-directed RNA polymerase I, II, and III subunit RPABC2